TSSSLEDFHESSSSESSDGTSGTPGLEPVLSSVPKPLCYEMCVSCLLLFSTSLSCSTSVLWISVSSTGVVALEGCFPLAAADSRGADSVVVVCVRVGGVVEEAESPFFFLALTF
nr:hypothetical protein [Tanacetum cinerariifolium]